MLLTVVTLAFCRTGSGPGVLDLTDDVALVLGAELDCLNLRLGHL